MSCADSGSSDGYFGESVASLPITGEAQTGDASSARSLSIVTRLRLATIVLRSLENKQVSFRMIDVLDGNSVTVQLTTQEAMKLSERLRLVAEVAND